MEQLNITPGKTALVTVDNWFYAPDGRMYRAVFGTVKGARTAEKTLGVRPNGKSTNWYLEIGCMTLAAGQAHSDELERDPNTADMFEREGAA